MPRWTEDSVFPIPEIAQCYFSHSILVRHRPRAEFSILLSSYWCVVLGVEHSTCKLAHLKGSTQPLAPQKTSIRYKVVDIGIFTKWHDLIQCGYKGMSIKGLAFCAIVLLGAKVLFDYRFSRVLRMLICEHISSAPDIRLYM